MIAMSKIVDDSQAQDETYRDVERLLYRLCWQAVYKYGGEWEDYLSAAHEAYADAYATFDATQGAAFSTWLWWKVQGAITGERHRGKIQTNTVACGEDIDLDALPGRSGFCYNSFLADLGRDAQTVVKMVVESPNEIWDLLHHKEIGSISRAGLCRRLQGIGWSVARVVESFSEIREALR